jgi:Ca2+-binding RTX toxin-like protein
MSEIIGTSRNDTIEGTAKSDDISGRNGADLIYGDGLNGPRPALPGENSTNFEVKTANRIFGENGNDTAYGGYGFDSLNGGNGDDWLHGTGVYSGKFSIYLAESDGADTLDGGNGKDHLFGDGGDDLLRGGNGNDHLDGGTGTDTMTGGAGADTFAFGRLIEQRKVPGFDTGDVITDFQDGVDRLDLTGFTHVFNGFNKPVEYLGQGAFTDPDRQQVRWEVQGDHTRVEVWAAIWDDPPGTPIKPDAHIDLAGVHHLKASDFILG